ncbi:MAG: hypothetical protein ABSB33_09935 [Tepidisphaeraceae bacterium]|jgi:hypothetical protein
MISPITGESRRRQQDRVQLARGSVAHEILAPASDIAELADAIINVDNTLIGKLGRNDLEMLLS